MSNNLSIQNYLTCIQEGDVNFDVITEIQSKTLINAENGTGKTVLEHMLTNPQFAEKTHIKLNLCVCVQLKIKSILIIVWFVL